MTGDEIETGSASEGGANIDFLRRRREIVATLAAVTLILGTMTAVAYYFLRPPPGDPHQIVAIAEKAVETQVGPNFRCAFPFFDEMSVAAEPGDTYAVGGWVQIISPSGQAQTATFECTVVTGGHGRWMPGQLRINY